jgi:hypothetical protein
MIFCRSQGRAAAVGLDDGELHRPLDPLVGGKPLVAVKAFAPPADRPVTVARRESMTFRLSLSAWQKGQCIDGGKR